MILEIVLQNQLIPGANLSPPSEPVQNDNIKTEMSPSLQLQVNPALTQRTKIPIIMDSDDDEPDKEPLQKKIKVLFCGNLSSWTIKWI